MRTRTLLGSALTGAALFASTAFAADASTVDPIVVKGKHFFYKTNGTEFFIRGVAYQQDYSSNSTANTNNGYTDPLADSQACMRDIPYLVQLRTNVIRTYAIDPTQNHDDCMNALAEAGIYVISDLSAPVDNGSINRNDPAWNDLLYQRYTAVIDNLSKYNNVIGFFAGNEVSNSFNTTAASAFVKAAVRDSKGYIKSQGYRSLYVGYATYDGPIRDQLAQYFNCGDQDDAIDFWGYNVYSWCGDSSYTMSGYDERTEFFRDYSVPAFFAEYGCIDPQPRRFTEVGTLFGPLMTGVWSGGIVYMYFQEANDYGLVQVEGNSVSKLPDFNYLSSQMAKISPSMTNMNEYNPAGLKPTTCPSEDESWMAKATPLPPSPNGQLCSCLYDALSCVVSSDVNPKGYESLFNYICGHDQNACGGISHNGTTGDYGAYGVCSPEQQLAYVMNRYYKDHGSQSSACDFDGSATLRQAATPTGTCVTLLSDAGAGGTGTVASPTAKATAQGVTGVAGGGSSSGTTTGAAVGLTIPNVDLAMLQVGAYVIGAVISGAGMILL